MKRANKEFPATQYAALEFAQHIHKSVLRKRRFGSLGCERVNANRESDIGIYSYRIRNTNFGLLIYNGADL